MLRITVLLTCFLSTNAWADLTIHGTHYPGPSGGTDRQVTYLRENEMKIDHLSTLEKEGDGGVANSILIRFSGHPSGLLYLDHESKRVQLLSSLRETGAVESANDSAGLVSVVKQDETREILGQTAHRYDFSFSGDVDPLALLGEQLPPALAGSVIIKLQVTGTSWIVPGMEGAGELAEFCEQLSKRQLTIGMLGQSLSETGQDVSFLSAGLSGALTDVFRQVTAAGFPLLTQTRSEMRVDMAGYMGGIIQGLLDGMGVSGPQSTEMIVTAVQTSKIAPELFYDGELPQGYSLNTNE